jgi:Fe-S cluster biosynthesis and repair protein YggX
MKMRRLLENDFKFIEALKKVAAVIADDIPGEHLLDGREYYYPPIQGREIWNKIKRDVDAKWIAANTLSKTFLELSNLPQRVMVGAIEEFLEDFTIHGRDPALERIYNVNREFYTGNNVYREDYYDEEDEFGNRLARRVASAWLASRR